MAERQQAQMEQYFTQNIHDCKALEQTLSADGRGDEAVFARVRGNVFDLFHTVFSVAVQTAGAEEEKVRPFFREKLDQIPANWRCSLEKAQAHGDLERMHTETIKLAALGEIDSAFRQIWGEAP